MPRFLEGRARIASEMAEGEAYADILFPEYFEDIFREEDLEFRFRLVRNHIHPKLRVMLSGCLDRVSEVLETDPLTFSRMAREPRSPDGIAERMQSALYSLKPNEVRGPGFPNLRSSSGRGRQVAEFDLTFFCDRLGVGLEFHVARTEELKLFQEVYQAYRDQIDSLIGFLRLGVDVPQSTRLVSLGGKIQAALDASDGWLAVFEPRYPFPIAAADFMERFEHCFVALYLIYDAMLSRALGIKDSFRAHFERVEEFFIAGQELGPGLDDDEAGFE